MPMTPLPYRVTDKRWETADTATLTMAPVDRAVEAPKPGQFLMLWAFGVGEVPISISGRPSGDLLEHTIRAAGPATTTLTDAPVGDVVGVRGPFGTEWEVERAHGGDLLIVAGGIGLAPLRLAIHSALEHRDRFRSVALLVGARSPDDLVFRSELDAWLDRTDVQVEITVDYAPGGGDDRWTGHVGLVTELFRQADVSTRVDGRVRLRPRGHDALHRPGAPRPRRPGPVDRLSAGTQHALRHRPLRALPARSAGSSAATGPSSTTPDRDPLLTVREL